MGPRKAASGVGARSGVRVRVKGRTAGLCECATALMLGNLAYRALWMWRSGKWGVVSGSVGEAEGTVYSAMEAEERSWGARARERKKVDGLSGLRTEMWPLASRTPW